jgi:hypothetical protein
MATAAAPTIEISDSLYRKAQALATAENWDLDDTFRFLIGSGMAQIGGGKFLTFEEGLERLQRSAQRGTHDGNALKRLMAEQPKVLADRYGLRTVSHEIDQIPVKYSFEICDRALEYLRR